MHSVAAVWAVCVGGDVCQLLMIIAAAAASAAACSSLGCRLFIATTTQRTWHHVHHVARANERRVHHVHHVARANERRVHQPAAAPPRGSLAGRRSWLRRDSVGQLRPGPVCSSERRRRLENREELREEPCVVHDGPVAQARQQVDVPGAQVLLRLRLKVREAAPPPPPQRSETPPRSRTHRVERELSGALTSRKD